MKHRLALLMLASSSAWAAVSGTVINQTTGKPQAGVTINLVKLGQGMDVVGTVTSDAAGKFSLPNDIQGPQLLQAQYEGVSYNKMLPPGTPTTDVELPVFNASKQPGEAKVSQHMMLLEPTPQAQLVVSETYFYVNNSKTAFSDPQNGTLHFYLPPQTNGQVKVTITAPGGMPIQRPAEKTKQANVYSVDYPIKPGGETRFDLSYQMPLGNPATFTGKVLNKDATFRLVTPNGVTLSGDAQQIGQEPTTQAMIYDVKGPDFSVAIKGTGTLRAPEQAQNNDQQDQGPQIDSVRPKLYDQLYWVLGLTFGILAVGFTLLLRQQPPASATKGQRGA